VRDLGRIEFASGRRAFAHDLVAGEPFAGKSRRAPEALVSSFRGGFFASEPP